MDTSMHRLSAEKILAVWEAGLQQHSLDRALTLLVAASPETARDTLAKLSIAERDARLFQLRTLIFGPRAEGFAECPRCTERVEFPLDTAEFARPKQSTASTRELEVNGRRLRFRMPNSRDLAAAVAAPDHASALRLLLERCSGTTDVPDECAEAISAALLEAEPQAEILLRLTCPGCAHELDLPFDIAEFFWTEISAQARRILREIDTLARAYGWTEREILSLPAQRRQTYLEMLAA